VAVTNQPISEVSALGIFLDWLFSHNRLQREFFNAKLRIIPSEHGKTVKKAQP
jgi:tRNA (cytidine56-2'-O)-methyltransferase